MSPYERRLAQARLADDAGEADKDNSNDSCVLLNDFSPVYVNISIRIVHGLVLAVKDVRIWIFALLNTSQLLGLSFVNFFPT